MSSMDAGAGGQTPQAQDRTPLSDKEIAMVRRLLSRPDILPEEFKGWLPKEIERNPPNIPRASIRGLNARSPGGVDLIADTPEKVTWRRQSDGAVVAYADGDRTAGFNAARLVGKGVGSEAAAALLEAHDNADALKAYIEAVYDGSTTVATVIAAAKAFAATLVETDASNVTRSHWLFDQSNGSFLKNGRLKGINGYYYITGIPADYSIRLYSSGAPGLYFSANMVAGTDYLITTPRVIATQAGTYLLMCNGSWDSAAFPAGSYGGVVPLRNGASWYTVNGSSTAQTKNLDGFPGGGGAGHLLVNMTAGEYFDFGVFQSNGYPTYITFTFVRLPL